MIPVNLRLRKGFQKELRAQTQAARERRAADKAKAKVQPKARTSLAGKRCAPPAPVTPPPLLPRQPSVFTHRAGAMDGYTLPSLGTFAAAHGPAAQKPLGGGAP